MIVVVSRDADKTATWRIKRVVDALVNVGVDVLYKEMEGGRDNLTLFSSIRKMVDAV